MANGTPMREQIAAELWPILRFPFQLLAIGLAVLVLCWLFSQVNLPVLGGVVQALSSTTGAIALLIFLVGLAFAGFLWWLTGRFFHLLSTGNLSAEQAAALKELPMALPEGTVRAVLALIVGVIGLPILLFSKTLDLSDAIAGYVNGIIIGVFSFYFGTRSAGVSTQAVNQIGAAQREAGKAIAVADQARQDAASSQSLLTEVTRASAFGTALDQLQRHVGLASALVNTIGPALPAGLLPAGLKDLLGTAQSVLADVSGRGVTSDTASQSDFDSVVGAVTGLIGSGGTGTSSIGSLLQLAAKLLPAAAIPALGPVAGIATLLGVGWRLGSAEFQRWRARVLAAPFATGLVEFGTLTAEEALEKLDDAPLFHQAFTPVRNDPELGAFLADAVLRDDAAARIWNRYGNATNDHASLFTSQQAVSQGLTEYRTLLVDDRSRRDVDGATTKSVVDALETAQIDAIKPGTPDAVSPDVVNAIIRAAGAASASQTADPPAQASFDALVTLVGAARVAKIDLPLALTELRP